MSLSGLSLSWRRLHPEGYSSDTCTIVGEAVISMDWLRCASSQSIVNFRDSDTHALPGAILIFLSTIERHPCFWTQPLLFAHHDVAVVRVHLFHFRANKEKRKKGFPSVSFREHHATSKQEVVEAEEEKQTSVTEEQSSKDNKNEDKKSIRSIFV